MQKNRAFVRGDIDVIGIGIHAKIGEDKRRLRDIKRLVDFVDGFGDLWKAAWPGIDEEHLAIWGLSAFSIYWSRYMASNRDFAEHRIINLFRQAWGLEFEI